MAFVAAELEASAHLKDGAPAQLVTALVRARPRWSVIPAKAGNGAGTMSSGARLVVSRHIRDARGTVSGLH